MKALKIAKYQAIKTIPSVTIYYAIFLTIIVGLVILHVQSGGNSSSSGLEMSSVIFLFIAGLNSFKSNFKFSQANNISRKTFFSGMIIGIFPITLLMSVIDLIINRVYNIFVHSPTNFDMIYGAFRDTGMYSWSRHSIVWIQENNLLTLTGTIIWQFAVYSMIFFMGILISLIYYRSSKLVKVIVSAIPIILLMLGGTIYNLLPVSFWSSLNKFLAYAFGWQSRNPYMAVFSFIILGGIFVSFAYLLTKKAVVKE